MKTIAVDLDDTLNNFTETLLNTQFSRDDSHVVSEEVFHDYIEKIRIGAPDTSELLSTEYSSFRSKIVSQCHELAVARTDGVEFMQWLRDDKWRIVICTHSDLRRDSERIKKWLRDNCIPFDYLFMAWNKLEYCKAWEIEFLVDDQPVNIVCGEHYGVKVFYPIMSKHLSLEANSATGFQTFDEVRQWIQK